MSTPGSGPPPDTGAAPNDTTREPSPPSPIAWNVATGRAGPSSSPLTSSTSCPDTRERIRGRDRYLAFNVGYPGEWHIEPQVVIGDGAHASLLFRWTLGDETSLAIAFFEVHGGTITKVTDFWPEPYEPPPGREHLVERW